MTSKTPDWKGGSGEQRDQVKFLPLLARSGAEEAEAEAKKRKRKRERERERERRSEQRGGIGLRDRSLQV